MVRFEEEASRISAEEVAAAYAEELFNYPHVWEIILDGEPSLKDRVLAFFKLAPKRYSFAPEMDFAAKKWIREYKKLFDQVAESEAGKNVSQNAIAGARVRVIGKMVDDNAIEPKNDTFGSNTNAKAPYDNSLRTKNGNKKTLTRTNDKNMQVSGERFAVLTEPNSKNKFVAIEPKSIEKLNNLKGDSLSAKVRNYLKKFRGTVLPLGMTDKAYMRREAEGEYTNPAKLLSLQDYEGKLNAAAEFENLLSASTFLRHEADNGRHSDAIRGWNYYELKYVVPVSDTEIRAYSGEIQIKLIARGDCFYDITKIRDITNGTAGQALIKAAGSVYDTSMGSISQNSQNSNTFDKISSKNIDSGERSAINVDLEAEKTLAKTPEALDSLTKSQAISLIQRGVEGDNLLNAADLAEEIKSVGGEITKDGNAVLYHGTSKENADRINSTGKMYGKEDGIFFSTKQNGIAPDY